MNPAPKTILVGAETLTYETSQGILFSGLSFGISAGDRLGLVGSNGVGKTTLLGLLAGDLVPNSGRVTYRRQVRVSYLPQHKSLPKGRLSQLFSSPDFLSSPWASSLSRGLLGDINLELSPGELSKGQRRRASLAKVLADAAEVLLLDEPTNHLDLKTTRWLIEHLARRWVPGTGALVLVTHDRWFLDALVDHTYQLNQVGLRRYTGGYSAYLAESFKNAALEKNAKIKRQNHLRRELIWLNRQPKARGSKARFRTESIKGILGQKPETIAKLELPTAGRPRLGRTVLRLEGVKVLWRGEPFLEEINLVIKPSDRLGILGVNGSGKSTLLDLISGALKPDRGRIVRGKTVRVAKLDQDFSSLEHFGNEPVFTFLKNLNTHYQIGGKSQSALELLERLGFGRDLLATPVVRLSGGQKRRLQLLQTILAEPNVLILDEPTNDVDVETVSALEDFLTLWAGCLIVVSHDRYFLERVTSDQYLLADRRLRHLPEGIEGYLRQLNRPSPARVQLREKSLAAKDYDRQREISALERKQKKLIEQIQVLAKELEEADSTDFIRLTELTKKHQELSDRLERVEDRWLELA